VVQRGSRQEIVAVAYDGSMPVAAAVVDADFIRQTSTDEAVCKHTIIVATQTHASDVVAVGRRGWVHR